MNGHQERGSHLVGEKNHIEEIPHDAQSSAQRAVASTVRIALRALDDEGLPECATLLQLLSCWSSSPVPVRLLSPESFRASHTDTLDPPLHAQRIEPALRGLLDYALVSLADVDHGPDRLRCLITNDAILDRALTSTDEQHDQLLVSAAELIGGAVSATPASLLAPHASRMMLRSRGTRTAQPVLEATANVAESLFEAGDFPLSLSLSEAAADHSLSWLGEDSPLTLLLRHLVALGMFRLGRYEESENLHREVLARRKQVLGGEHHDTLESLRSLHEPLAQLGRPEAALTALQAVENTQIGLLGADHPDTLKTRALAIEYMATTGDADLFDSNARQTLADCEQALGTASLTTVTASHNYAYGLFRFGRLDEAELAARRALDRRERFHGPRHPLALSGAVLLSWILRDRGVFSEAIILARRAAAGQEASLGAEHPYVLENRTSLASMLATVGSMDEARQLVRQHLAACNRILGADHPTTAESRRILG